MLTFPYLYSPSRIIKRIFNEEKGIPSITKKKRGIHIFVVPSTGTLYHYIEARKIPRDTFFWFNSLCTSMTHSQKASSDKSIYIKNRLFISSYFDITFVRGVRMRQSQRMMNVREKGVSFIFLFKHHSFFYTFDFESKQHEKDFCLFSRS